MLLKKIFNRLRIEYRNFFYKNISILLAPFFKTSENIMLFGSMNGKFIDNTKYLFIQVSKARNFQHKAVWITDNLFTLQSLKKSGYPVVFKWSFECLVLVLKAKHMFVTHSQANIFPFKKKNTLLINLWHGSPLKKMGYDSSLDKNNKRIKQYQDWDYLITAHETFVPFFESALNITKDKILPLGLPRNSILWQSEKYETILRYNISKQYGFDSERKIILYAPTFRDTQKSRLDFHKEIEMLIEKFNRKSQDKYILLLRLHPFDKLDINLISNNSIFDCSNYPDIQELLVISNQLITDYSSCMFDFSIMRKKIILFLFDSTDYKKTRNGFYLDVNALPFEKVFTINQLIDTVFSKNNLKVINSQEEYNKRFSLIELLSSIERR